MKAAGWMALRIPLGVQVGAVGALFVAALIVLWTTGALVVARERRRAESKDLLRAAGNALAARGGALIAHTEGFPYFPDNQAQDQLGRVLADAAAASLQPFEGIEGGYFVSGFHRFLGTTRGKPRDPEKAKAKPVTPPDPTALPPVEADLIDILVDAAIRKNHDLYSIAELDDPRPVTVALRTAPILVGSRIVGATWVMTRLVDPPFVDRSFQGYQLASGLALGGIVLALSLTTGLARTVRKQAVERERLQTELRRSERLAALGKLLAGVAHEVRNPLAGIRSTVQLWERGIGPDPESFEGLLEEVNRLEGIVARLLHFSRADAQDLAPGDLNAVVAEAARLARTTADAQGVRIELELDRSVPSAAIAPPALLQVYRNLTVNALQAMPAGGVLKLATHHDPAHNRIVSTVADTGPGLSPEIQAHLFEPFYTTKSGGTGLGLAIAREIVLAHHGDLKAANQPQGSGAVFTLTLPALSDSHQGESP